MKRTAIVLLSGGLDSVACLHFCKHEDLPVLALTIDYGQRAARQEIAAARYFAERTETEHRVIELRWMEFGAGLLGTHNSHKPLPQFGQSKELDLSTKTRESAALVWVPNRNGVFIEAAAALAESRKASGVVVGFNLEEAATFPDNSQEYLEAINRALEFSTQGRVRVWSYTAKMRKPEIARELKRLDPEFPFHKLWSCYENGERPCWSCESCVRLKRAINT